MPNLAWTYTTLLQALQTWPVHASAKYVSDLPTLIGLGERRLWGDLNIEEYDKEDTTNISTATGNRLVAKPADVIQVRNVGLLIAGQYTELELRSLDYCKMFAPDATLQAPPQYYTEYTYAQILVVPTPGAIYPVHYHYIGALPESLNTSTPNASTWLSRAGPDALFAACLMEAEHYVKADDRYADWKDKYQQELLPRLRAEIRKSIRAGDYSPMKGAAAVAQ